MSKMLKILRFLTYVESFKSFDSFCFDFCKIESRENFQKIFNRETRHTRKVERPKISSKPITLLIIFV